MQTILFSKYNMMGALLAVLLMSTFTQNTYANTPMTAGVIIERMELKERYGYVAGIIEGMAYARFRKDTIATGAKNEQGMKCIYNWFYKDKELMFTRIERVFSKNAKHYPTTLLGVMLKKECGE